MWLNKKQNDRAVLPKPKLIVYIGRSQKKFLNLTPSPKLALKRSEKCQKGPNCSQIENKKDGVVLSHNQSCKYIF